LDIKQYTNKKIYEGNELAMNTPLTTKLCSLMLSDDYENWLQAWELIRDNMPGNITTFDDLDETYDLDMNDCFISDMLYDLDAELSALGLDDLHLLAKRVEIARWVYTHFPDETELNLGNFRGHEAEALWDLGQREEAETRYQELTETFPNFTWGYIWWGDQYWMSDWSYDDAPDYDRAESLYRQALDNPHLDNHVYVQDRLDDLNDEKEHPERREQIKQTRLKYIERRQSSE
jgi:tetratricopeptide (TPR) repeat protein